MKKTLVWIIGTVVVVLIAILVSFMITKSTTTNTSNSDFSSTEPIQSMEGEYIVAGVGPEMSFQPEVAEDTLVMNRYIDNSVDHLFIDNSSQTLAPDDLLPGTTIAFSGQVQRLDAAAGNHYYQVISIDHWQKIKEPGKAEIQGNP